MRYVNRETGVVIDVPEHVAGRLGAAWTPQSAPKATQAKAEPASSGEAVKQSKKAPAKKPASKRKA